MTDKFYAKNAELFICETCDFKSSKKFVLTRHLSTQKHKILTNTYTNYANYANTNKNINIKK